ncbi:IS5 family transposase [Candidatus Gottesmanbacteria bacterium]|nr:IS5 family transposase [Candidatus Gottesmanbacteria bacterium]
MVYVDGKGIPIALEVESAQKSEVKLALQTIDQVSISGRPLHPRKRAETICADKAYDASWLRDALRARNIKPKIPKKRKRGQKDEPLYNQTIVDYYRTRWIVERTISWFSWYRRILMRWERQDDIYEAFVTLACIMICLKRVLL